MDTVVDFLADNAQLLLFVTLALGILIGRIHVKGASIGVAAVLFVGLLIGSQSADFALPEFVRTFGLVIFVYTIGLSAGAGFFASFSRKSLRENGLVVLVLVIGAGLAIATAKILDLNGSLGAGFFAGATTNTPALAQVLDAAEKGGASEALLKDPTIGYSIAYPMGVLGPILAIAFARWLFKINYRKEAARLAALHLVQEDIESRTIKVTQPGVIGRSIREIQLELKRPIVFSRILRGEEEMLAEGDVRLEENDLVCIVGEAATVTSVASLIGELDEHQPELNRSHYDFRRIFVSNTAVVGRPLKALGLPEHYDAIVTRVRRGDIDVTATGDTVLELGDRVRVVAKRSRMAEVSARLGDSYKHLSEIDLLSFGLGITLGLLLGAIPVPLPGGITFELGSAGGVLVAGLVLGAVRRTGPIVWTIPYGANLTLRQMGLAIFLAVVGLTAGFTFRDKFSESNGVGILLASVVICIVVPLLTVLIGYKFLKVPFGQLMGVVAGQHTQPAVLGYSLDQTKDEAPNVGWATVYPVAMITKIVLAQAVFVILGGVG